MSSGTDPDHEEYGRVAREAVEEAGAYLNERFRATRLNAEYTAGDVKTEADHGAERRVLDRLRERYPDHAVTAEESGDHQRSDDSAYRWVVDALDGTNNFAAGIPTFGVAVTLTDADGPLVTCVGVPVLGDVYLARRGEGVTYNGRPVAVDNGDGVPPSHATVGWVIGAPVRERDALQREYERRLSGVEEVCKRVVRTWAPVVYWALLARGRLDGFVAFHPDEREQVAGALLAREAGCVEGGEGPLTVFGRDDRTCETLLAAAEADS
jgi:myo-inositol-1(or 4)-monophosphatase